MIPCSELEKFFCELVATVQERGIPCAINSGMACVHFGVAATTKDCDVLCNVEKSDKFRTLRTLMTKGRPLIDVSARANGNPEWGRFRPQGAGFRQDHSPESSPQVDKAGSGS